LTILTGCPAGEGFFPPWGSNGLPPAVTAAGSDKTTSPSAVFTRAAPSLITTASHDP